MKTLTLKKFLRWYLTELSLCGSSSIKKLEQEVEHNLRLLEPLALYIKLKYKNKWHKKVTNMRVAAQLHILDSTSQDMLPEGYQKVYNSYKYFCQEDKKLRWDS